MSNIQIPKNAVFLNNGFKIHNTDEWFCPNCGAKGDSENLDYIPIHTGYEEDTPFVQYVCGECFEDGIYVTTINE